VTTISGTIQKGHGIASGAIERQVPHLSPYVPEIVSMKYGTINVHLDTPVLIQNYEIITPPIEWAIGFAERFFIIRASFRLEPEQNQTPCLVYFASTSPYFQKSPIFSVLEIVTSPLDLDGKLRCSIIFGN